MKTLRSSVVLAAMVMCCCAPLAFGQESEPASETDAEVVDLADDLAEPAILDELQDPAFDQYIDLEFLRDAWASLDPSALADTGLQLAEGERILFRSHKAGSADTVLEMAVRVAIDARDRQTLDRLARAVASLKKPQFAARLAVAQKLAGEPRAAGPSVALDQVTQTDVQVMSDVMDAVRQARARGDVPLLGVVGTFVQEHKGLSKPVQDHLQQTIADAIQNPPGGRNGEADLLDKLAGSSRANKKYWFFHNLSGETLFLQYRNTPSSQWSVVREIPANYMPMITGYYTSFLYVNVRSPNGPWRQVQCRHLINGAVMTFPSASQGYWQLRNTTYSQRRIYQKAT